MRIAAVDIGTVTTRLLIGDVVGERVTEVVRSTDITHLGEGLTHTGELGIEAMERVADVVERYARVMREHGVNRYGAVATSATRDASNSAAFLGMLAARGLHVEVISGDREAWLTFRGATHELGHGSVLVDDIGGGSTELILGSVAEAADRREATVLAAHSIDVGSRRLTEMFLASDPPASDELETARRHVTAQLGPFLEERVAAFDELISVAGTATSLSAIKQGLVDYDPALVHGSVLRTDDVTGLLAMLAGMPLVLRCDVAGLHPGRAQVIVAGAIILEAIMRLSGVDSTVVSEHDILYGVLLQA